MSATEGTHASGVGSRVFHWGWGGSCAVFVTPARCRLWCFACGLWDALSVTCPLYGGLIESRLGDDRAVFEGFFPSCSLALVLLGRVCVGPVLEGCGWGWAAYLCPSALTRAFGGFCKCFSLRRFNGAVVIIGPSVGHLSLRNICLCTPYG